MSTSPDGYSTATLPTDPPFSGSRLERSVLLTVLYADLFDYALTEEELYGRLIACRASRDAVREAVRALDGRYLSVTGPYVTWKGREPLAALRRDRSLASGALWAAARRYAAWLARVPFVRMVAVSGSLAVDNADAQSDVDLFCIVAPGRLWIARLCIVPLSRLTRIFSGLFPRYLCPNYLLTADGLRVEDRNLFTAHEVVQAVPLWGGPFHDAFLRANRWVDRYLPHQSGAERTRHLPDPPRPLVTRCCERLLRGRTGDVLDEAVYRLFRAFYRRRALRAGWAWERLEHAYQRNRYTVPEGGYVRVVRALFARRVRERLGATAPDGTMDGLFGFRDDGRLPSCYDWAGRFRQEYGAAAAARPAL